MNELNFENANYQILQENCLDGMRKIKNETIDCIICDPPYGMEFQSNWVDSDKRKNKIIGDERPFIWFLYESFRILKNNSFLICFCEWKRQEIFKMALNAAGFKVRSQGVWDRMVHGMGDLKGGLAPSHDLFWLATKGKPIFFGKRLNSVLRYQRIDPAKLVHPAEKPVPLLRELIRSCSPYGGIVFDPMAGSGTTGQAAIMEGRKFLGFELDGAYVDIAKNRVSYVAENQFDIKNTIQKTLFDFI